MLVPRAINKSRSVYKLCLARGDNIHKVRQLLGNRRQIGIKDHQNIARGSIETRPDISRFTYAWPAFQANILVWIKGPHTQHLFRSAIGRLIVAENDFGLPPLPTGRHQLEVDGVACALTIAPPEAYRAEAARRPRFGVSAQLYALRRRQGDQGIGDFTTLGLAGATADTVRARATKRQSGGRGRSRRQRLRVIFPTASGAHDRPRGALTCSAQLQLTRR